MDCAAFATSLVGGLVSSAIVGIALYFLAAKDLKRKASELRSLNEFQLRALEEAGYVELKRNACGQITGYTISLKGNAVADSKAEGTLSSG
jgi:hypothetical protein